MSSLNDKTLIFVYGTLKRNQPNHAILVERSDVTFISEGTTANIFVVKDSVLYTPTTKNILNGFSLILKIYIYWMIKN